MEKFGSGIIILDSQHWVFSLLYSNKRKTKKICFTLVSSMVLSWRGECVISFKRSLYSRSVLSADDFKTFLIPKTIPETLLKDLLVAFRKPHMT
jgi:hypothetical protein